MASSDLELKQRRLGSLRGAIVSCWILSVLAVVGTVAWAGLRIQAQVNDLMAPGPARQKMTTALESRVAHSVGSKLKADVGRTFRELQPILREKAAAVDAQSADVAGAAVKALARFRDDVPVALIQPWDAQLDEYLRAHRGEIAAHASGKREADIDSETRAVRDVIHTRFLKEVAPFARPYQDEVSQILSSAFKIRDQEAPNVRGVRPTWDMDLMVLEEMHREVSALRSMAEGPAK